jgi:hypothetical protein
MKDPRLPFRLLLLVIAFACGVLATYVWKVL